MGRSSNWIESARRSAQLTDEGQALTAGVELPAAEGPDVVVDGQPGRRDTMIDDIVLIWRGREHSTGEIVCGRQCSPCRCCVFAQAAIAVT
ncbi:MAG TPA: hypothetical protein VFH80_18400 [Solirubrobacteraceae bacterium]|nr:hypothetical protein [Solirubrobacteraceae bacterium]